MGSHWSWVIDVNRHGTGHEITESQDQRLASRRSYIDSVLGEIVSGMRCARIAFVFKQIRKEYPLLMFLISNV